MRLTVKSLANPVTFINMQDITASHIPTFKILIYYQQSFSSFCFWLIRIPITTENTSKDNFSNYIVVSDKLLLSSGNCPDVPVTGL